MVFEAKAFLALIHLSPALLCFFYSGKIKGKAKASLAELKQRNEPWVSEVQGNFCLTLFCQAVWLVTWPLLSWMSAMVSGGVVRTGHTKLRSPRTVLSTGHKIRLSGEAFVAFGTTHNQRIIVGLWIKKISTNDNINGLIILFQQKQSKLKTIIPKHIFCLFLLKAYFWQITIRQEKKKNRDILTHDVSQINMFLL